MKLTLVRVIVSLFDERQLFTLRLIQTPLDGVRLLQLLESKNQQLGVVLVVERAMNAMSSSSRNVARTTYGNGMGENFRLSSQCTVAV